METISLVPEVKRAIGKYQRLRKVCFGLKIELPPPHPTQQHFSDHLYIREDAIFLTYTLSSVNSLISPVTELVGIGTYH